MLETRPTNPRDPGSQGNFSGGPARGEQPCWAQQLLAHTQARFWTKFDALMLFRNIHRQPMSNIGQLANTHGQLAVAERHTLSGSPRGQKLSVSGTQQLTGSATRSGCYTVASHTHTYIFSLTCTSKARPGRVSNRLSASRSA
jgi:hypothetical protein